MVHFFQTASNERVGMALDKLPDPLPPRHWEQWGGRAICRQGDAYIRLHPFLLDEVMAVLIRTRDRVLAGHRVQS